MLKVKKFVFGGFGENTYVVWDELSKSGAVIDPGCIMPNEEEEFTAFIEQQNINLKYLIVTHGHVDHVAGCDFVFHKFTPEFFVPEKDLELINHATETGLQYGMQIKQPPTQFNWINEETPLFLGSSKLTFLYTPGHTPGEYCVYFQSENICFTGDVLFKGSIGRTDLWGGDHNILMDSIYVQLLTLPEETIIYPGHGDSTTIGNEMTNNPFLSV